MGKIACESDLRLSAPDGHQCEAVDQTQRAELVTIASQALRLDQRHVSMSVAMLSRSLSVFDSGLVESTNEARSTSCCR
jgi:hypothetical protein